jgi:RNase H-fold protein (predicted Holliday junction resolvase)
MDLDKLIEEIEEIQKMIVGLKKNIQKTITQKTNN